MLLLEPIKRALSRAFAPASSQPPTYTIDEVLRAGAVAGRAVNVWQDGDKYAGGFGTTKVFIADLWTLRQRSEQLFKENLYAVGLLRRFITNEINTGLTLEATPSELILDLDSEVLTDWAEEVEARFGIWSQAPKQCDWLKESTFGALQRIVRLEALITGDVLVVLRQDPVTKLPRVQLVSGQLVQPPLGAAPRAGNKIVHGVELDKNGRQVAYHIQQTDGTSKRLAAFGERSGRRIAWLVYGTQKRLGGVRGEPLLALILQSLKEIDRYRDSEQRAAVINAMIALSVKKEHQLPGTKPMSGGAVRKGTVETTDLDGTPRTFTSAKYLPGMVIDELQAGESLQSHDTSRPNVNFAAFESSIIHAIAWANEMPPEVLQLAFSKNYSASRGAVNEYKMYLNKSRSERADEFDKPVYISWLLAEVLTGKIAAPGLLAAWRDPLQQDIFGAWILSDWGGAIKPSVDPLKEANAYKVMVEEGWITRDRASKELTGMKFSTNVKRLKIENEMLAEASEPLSAVEDSGAAFEAQIRGVVEAVMEEAREDGDT